MFRRLGLNALCALCCFALTGAVLGQTNRATINGTIADQNGAAVPGATIKIEQSATGLALSATSSDSGDFAFPDLQPGIYTITISHDEEVRKRRGRCRQDDDPRGDFECRRASADRRGHGDRAAA